ncbi:MAG: hypothetical protein AAF938_16495 [Myxococcota bacterium]
MRVLSFGLLLSACSGQYQITLTFSEDGTRAESRVAEVAVVPSCAEQELGPAAGNSVRQVVFRVGEEAPSIGTLDTGDYGLYARTLDANCQVISAGCRPVSLSAGGDGTLDVVLRPVSPALPQCSESVCAAGICGGTSRDAGVERDVAVEQTVETGIVGSERVLDECSPSSDLVPVTVTTERIIVDTRSFQNTLDESRALDPTCELTAAGPDAFLPFEAVEGQLWHFRLSALEGDDPTRADATPSIYVVGPACDLRSQPVTCDASSNVCQGRGDERLAFRVPFAGIFRLVVDDDLADGTVYELNAYLVACGDNVKTAGEACDPTAPDGLFDCSEDCHIIFDENGAGPSTTIPAFSTTRPEAVLVSPSSPGTAVEMVVPLGAASDELGAACAAPAVVAVDLRAPTGTTPDTLTVRNDDCENAAPDGASDEYTVSLFDENGTVVGGVDTDEFFGRSCQRIEFTPERAAGDLLRYFIEIRPTRPDAAQSPTFVFTIAP